MVMACVHYTRNCSHNAIIHKCLTSLFTKKKKKHALCDACKKKEKKKERINEKDSEKNSHLCLVYRFVVTSYVMQC